MSIVEVGVHRYGLGRHLNAVHDARSLTFPAERAPVVQSVQHVHDGPVLDQGETGSCTGHALVQALNTEPLWRVGRRLLTTRDALELYSLATRTDPFPGTWPPQDTGSDGLNIAKAARSVRLISAYRHAFGLQHVLKALTLRPLIIGIPWRESMFTPGPDGRLTVKGDVAGGHEVALIGLSTAEKSVTLLNSWGPGWGAKGRAYLAWDDLGALLADGGDATALLPEAAKTTKQKGRPE